MITCIEILSSLIVSLFLYNLVAYTVYPTTIFVKSHHNHLIIKNGAKLGGKNREWIFNDSQLIATVQMASLGGNTLLINKLDRLEKLLASQSIETRISGQDILISQKRTIHANNIRKR